MIINIRTQNRSHKILVLSFGRSHFSLLNLGLARLDQLVGSDVVLNPSLSSFRHQKYLLHRPTRRGLNVWQNAETRNTHIENVF
jgi:hypothetical protein